MMMKTSLITFKTKQDDTFLAELFWNYEPNNNIMGCENAFQDISWSAWTKMKRLPFCNYHPVFLYLNSRARSIRSLKKLAMDIGKCRVDTQRIQWWSWCVQSNRKIEQREWHNESAAPPMPPRLSLFFLQTKRSPHSSNFFFTDNVHAIVIALFRSRLFRVCQMKNRKKNG